MNLENGMGRILQYNINDTQLTIAVKQVFAGNTFFLDGLKSPFSMFSETTRQSAPQPDRFNKAVVFPIPADDAKITHSVIVFMP